MLYVSQLQPHQLVALEFQSPRELSAFLRQLPPGVDFTIVGASTVIVPRAHEPALADRAMSLRLGYKTAEVLDPSQIPAKELAEHRAQRFRQKPDAATRKQLIDAVRAVKG